MKTKLFILFLFQIMILTAFAQESGDSTNKSTEKDKRPVKDAFESNWLINSQTMIVPFAHTLEFDINHRFGPMNNGFKDMLGMYAPSNIRLALTYTPLKNLQLGMGMTKEAMMYDFNIKWNPLQQTRSGSFPVFITYNGNMVIEGTENAVLYKKSDGSEYKKFPKYTNRFSYFHQIIIGRKINNWLTLQLAPAFTHYNLIDTAATNGIQFDNFVVSFSGRVKLTAQMSAIFEYYHPFTPAKDVKPNLALGIEASTGSHAFQIFLSPYTSIINQRDIVFNKKDFLKKEFAIGFNITRMWNF